MSASDRYRDRVVARLRALLRSHGTSVRAVEKRLGHGRGYVSDALRGQKKLGLEVILEVLAALRVPPEEFFETSPMPTERNSRRPPAPRRELAPLSKAAPRDVRAIADALLLFLAERGVVSADQLAELQRDLASRESALAVSRRVR